MRPESFYSAHTGTKGSPVNCSQWQEWQDVGYVTGQLIGNQALNIYIRTRSYTIDHVRRCISTAICAPDSAISLLASNISLLWFVAEGEEIAGRRSPGGAPVPVRVRDLGRPGDRHTRRARRDWDADRKGRGLRSVRPVIPTATHSAHTRCVPPLFLVTSHPFFSHDGRLMNVVVTRPPPFSR